MHRAHSGDGREEPLVGKGEGQAMKPTDRGRHRYHAEVRQAMECANQPTIKFN